MAPIRKYAQFYKEFILSMDSSDFSIGYVLSQVHEGKEIPVCYDGQALQNNEPRMALNRYMRNGLV